MFSPVKQYLPKCALSGLDTFRAIYAGHGLSDITGKHILVIHLFWGGGEEG